MHEQTAGTQRQEPPPQGPGPWAPRPRRGPALPGVVPSPPALPPPSSFVSPRVRDTPVSPSSCNQLVKKHFWSSHCGSVERNLTSIHENTGSIPGLAQWVKDLVLLWLWCRPVAVAPIGPLAWELPCTTGAALKTKKGNSFQTLEEKQCKTAFSEEEKLTK